MSELQLPPEILGIIFENLHPKSSRKRKSDLASCTMVCRAWSGAAQRHMFRRVKYSFSKPNEGEEIAQKTGGKLGNNTMGRRGESPKSLGMLRQFLEKTPTVCPHVQHLLLFCYPSNSPPELFQLPDEVEPAELLALLDLLPGLNNLYMREVSVSWGYSRAGKLSRHPGVRHLNLDSRIRARSTVYLDDFRVTRLLSWFAEVVYLRLDCVGGAGGGSPHVPFPFDTVIRHLTLSNTPNNGAIFRYLAQSPAISSLRCLIIRSIDVAEHPGVQRFIDIVGPHLEVLQILLLCQEDLKGKHVLAFMSYATDH